MRILALESCADGSEGFFGLRTLASNCAVVNVGGQGYSQPLMCEQAWVVFALGVPSSVFTLRLGKPPVEGVSPPLWACLLYTSPSPRD